MKTAAEKEADAKVVTDAALELGTAIYRFMKTRPISAGSIFLLNKILEHMVKACAMSIIAGLSEEEVVAEMRLAELVVAAVQE